MIWGDIVSILIFSCIIISSFWKSYGSTVGCFSQPQRYISTLFYGGFFALFLFLSSDLTSCLCPSVLSVCLGVHWFSVVMWFCSLFVSWCSAPHRSVVPLLVPFPSSPSLPTCPRGVNKRAPSFEWCSECHPEASGWKLQNVHTAS